MELDPDSVDDDFLLPPAPPVRALGKFRPKAHPKPVKSVQTPSKPQTVKSVQTPSKSLVASLSEELPVRVPNTESAGENSILGIASVSEERMIERISVERAQVSDSDASVCVHSDKIEAEAMIYSPGLESVDEGVFQSCPTSGDMDLDPDSVDEDFLLPPAAPVRALGKFRPKAHPKAGKSVQAPSKPPIAPPRMEPLVHVTDSESAGENLSLPIAPVSQERMGQEGIYVERAQVYDNDLSLCVHSDKIEAVAMTSSPGLESVGDGVFQSRATSGSMDLDPDSVPEDFRILSAAPVRALGKFRPKAHPKTVKSVQAPAKPPVAPPSAEPPVHVPNQESAGENSSLRIAPVSEERMTEERISAERTPVSDNDASLCIHLDKIEAEGMASCSGLESERDTAGTMDLDTDSVSDDLLLPPAPAVRALGKFRPKAHPKTVKSVQTPSKPLVANQLVRPVMEPPRRVSDLTSPDKKSSLRIASFSEERMIQEGISVERAQASDSDASLFVHLDKAEAEALASSPGMESADDGFFQSRVTSGAMDLDTDSVPDDLLLPPARAVRALGKFCPKAHPKTVKLVQAPSKPPVADQLVPPVMEPAGHVSDPTIPDKKLSFLIASFSEERMTQEGISVERAQASDSDASLCVHPDKTEAEAMTSSRGMESADDGIFQSHAISGVTDLDANSVHDDFFLSYAPAVGKFRPKAHPKAIKPVQASLKSLVVTQLVPLIVEPPICDSSLESQDEKLSLPVPVASIIDCSLTNASDVDTTHGSVCHPEVFALEPFVPGGNNEDISQRDQEQGEGGMDLDTDSLAEGLLLPPTPAVRALGKFRPKAHPKTAKPIQAPPKLHVAKLVHSIRDPPVRVSDPESPDESNLQIASIDDSLINASDLGTTHWSVCQQEDFSLETSVTGCNNEVTLQLDQGEREVADMLSMECVDLNQPLPTLGRAVGRFKPKAELESKDDKLSTTYVTDPDVIMSDSTQGHSISSSAVEFLLPEHQFCQEPFYHNEERMTQEGISPERVQLSCSDPHSHIHPEKLEVDVAASFTCLESVDDGLFQSHAISGAVDLVDVDYVAEDSLLHPSSASVRPLGKFQPKAHPKSNKLVQAPSKPSVATQVTPITEPPLPVPEPKSSDERSSLPNASINDCLVDASGLDSTQGFICQPEAFPSEPFVSGVNNAETSQREQGGTEIHSVWNAEDILLQPSPAIVRPLGKFQPKTHPKSIKSVQTRPKPSVATQVAPITEPLVPVPEPKSPDERSSHPNASINDCLVDTSGFDTTQGSVCQPKAFPSEPFVSDVNNEETSQHEQGGTKEAMDLDVDAVAEDFLLQSAPAVKEAGRFRPKLVPRPKEKKVKRVSFNLPDAAETVHLLDNHVSFSQSEGTEKVACSTTEVEPSFLEMLCEGSLDEMPDSAFVVSDCSGDIGMGRIDLREEDTTEIAGLESLEKIPSQSTTKIGKFQPKISSIIKNVKTNAPVTTHDVLASIHSERDSPPLESESLERHALIVPPDSQFDSVITGDLTPADLILEQANHVDTCASSEYKRVVGRETSPELSKDISKEDQSHDADVTDQIFNEKSTSKVVEEGASKSSRKARKRVNKRTLVVEVHEDRDFDNSNIHEAEDARNDDEYKGEDAPKPKRGRRKLTKPVTDNEKPTRKRKKALEELKSPEEEPKKKFPHSTRRNRRQVNKELLLMPDDEIDRRRLSIKDLIRTYEAKERISSKESAAGANSSSNQSHKSFLDDTHHDTDNGIRQSWDSYGDEENDDVQLNDTTVKWNHHSFRKKPSSTSRWSKSETELFYQALRQFGTNFEMIQKLFPGRTRHQMTLKFKNERRKFPLQVADATTHPSTDFSLVKLVMQKLAEEEEDKAKEKVFYVQDEDENGQTEKEEQEGNDWEGGLDSSVKAYEGVGAAQSPNQLNEYEDNLEWDANSSYFHDGEKNEYDGFY